MSIALNSACSSTGPGSPRAARCSAWATRRPVKILRRGRWPLLWTSTPRPKPRHARFPAWRRTRAIERAQLLPRIAALIRRDEALLAASRGNVFADQTRSFSWAPTVIADDAHAMQSEPFGTLALITPFNEIDEAIARANATEHGLPAYAFTRSPGDARALEHGLEAGNVRLSIFAISAPEMPFSGQKQSGLGSETGREGLLDHLHVTAVVRAWV